MPWEDSGIYPCMVGAVAGLAAGCLQSISLWGSIPPLTSLLPFETWRHEQVGKRIRGLSLTLLHHKLMVI